MVDLVEHGASNTTIAMLSVTDDDRGDNGQVTCRMTSDGQGHFKVARLHDTVYRIISTRPLDSRPVSTPPPVLFWWRNDMLPISGFVDDVIFAHKLRLLDVAARLKQ